MAAEKQKLRFLYLMRILYWETDSDHGLTMPQIIEKLAEHGVTAERKAVYRDFEALREFGVSLIKLPTSPVEYALKERLIPPADLELLVDVVQGCPYLSDRKASDLVRYLRKLSSRERVGRVNKHIRVMPRVRLQSESIFGNVNVIQRAMTAHRKVEFRTFRYGPASKPQPLESAQRAETPVELLFSDGRCYLVAFSDEAQELRTYRVDRIRHVRVSDQPAARSHAMPRFDVDDLASRTFGVLDGEPVFATLRVDPELMDALVDRFGRDVRMRVLPDGILHVYQRVVQTPAFFGWVARFGDRIQIEGPPSLRRAYADHVASIARVYFDQVGKYVPFGGDGSQAGDAVGNAAGDAARDAAGDAEAAEGAGAAEPLTP
ncbi:MAG: WYL domain-containing protein [Coriobacteriia bacterium]|nr:WYL domain-containing protein [Coriobacteriia bacterium]